MRQTLCLTLAWLMIINLLSSAAAADDIAGQITSLPVGTKMEIRLKSRERLRGSRGDISNSGFALVNSQKITRQIVFDDVASVKQIDAKSSHVKRNVLIIVGVAAAVTAAIFGVAYDELKKCGPLGCSGNSR
jgi:hypothetical protein